MAGPCHKHIPEYNEQIVRTVDHGENLNLILKCSLCNNCIPDNRSYFSHSALQKKTLNVFQSTVNFTNVSQTPINATNVIQAKAVNHERIPEYS